MMELAVRKFGPFWIARYEYGFGAGAEYFWARTRRRALAKARLARSPLYRRSKWEAYQ